ncbi:hypothetical protein ACWEWP_34310 [Streptomyces olivaceus]
MISYALAELRSKHPGVDDQMLYLPDPADPTEYETVADQLWDLLLSARNLVPARSMTGCDLHPNGPVDTERPEGWGNCLLCNQHRRIGRPGVRAAAKPAKAWAMPEPPFFHATLMATRKEISDAVQDLDYRSHEDAFQHVVDLVHAAFVIARELSRPRISGCQRHPGAPIDPAADGGPRCLFCVGDERRRRLGPPTVSVRPSRPVPQVRPRPHRYYGNKPSAR